MLDSAPHIGEYADHEKTLRPSVARSIGIASPPDPLQLLTTLPAGDDRRMLRHAPDVVAQQASGRHVLLNVRTGQYYAVEEVAARVWELCDGTRTIPDVVAAIVVEYETTTETADTDVNAFVSELLAESLLV